MSPLPITEVISFTTEHPVHKVNNIVRGSGRWTSSVKNVSNAAKGQEVTEIHAEFKLPLCFIEAVDIGNFWSSTIDIQVGRSGEPVSSRLPLLNSPLNLMTRLDCRSGNNAEAMRFFFKDDLNPKVSGSSKGWDRIIVTCIQNYKNDVLFGLSTLSLRGKRLDKEIVLSPLKNSNLTPVNKSSSKQQVEKKDYPEWYVPESRASKLLSKSIKGSPKENRRSEAKENRPNFVSPERKMFRNLDDLSPRSSGDKLSAKLSRNRILDQDSPIFSPVPSTSKDKRFNFKSSKPNIQDSSKPAKPINIRTKSDFLKYSPKSLKAYGVLVQQRSYKKPKQLPMKNGKMLKVDANQDITFYKHGKHIVLVTKNKIHDPFVDPDHVEAIFKDYSKDVVMATDFQETDLSVVTDEIPDLDSDVSFVEEPKKQSTKKSPKKSMSNNKCPLCQKSFAEENELLQHAADCNGVEELTEERCPICDRSYPPEKLPEHAQECAQYMFD